MAGANVICACESIAHGELGVVAHPERLARIVFNPRHISKDGGLKPSIFPLSHIAKTGVSVMRMDYLSLIDFTNKAGDVAGQMAGQSVAGAICAKASDIRNLVDEEGNQSLCVLDDPVIDDPVIPDNIAHALCISSRERSESDIQSIQADLITIFSRIQTLEDAHKTL